MHQSNNTQKDFSKIPANACLMHVGEFALGSNGEKAKTVPVRLLARSSQPVKHWFWGRIVHDISGFKSKTRIPIDYAHDTKEVIGYLNHFENEPDGLAVSGALVPFKDSDRATEIIHKMGLGVPYEASINFGGDGMKILQVDDGEQAEVNGFMFDGPGVIVREWPLRGVAICPYGADANTDSAMLSEDNKKTFSAEVITSKPEPQQEDKIMADDAIVVEAKEPKTDEAKAEETAAEPVAEAAQAVVEAAPVVAPVEAAALAKEPDARKEFARMKTAFGLEIASEVFEAGGSYEDARDKFTAKIVAENASLREQVAELANGNGGGKPAEFTSSDRVSVDPWKAAQKKK